MHTSVNYHPEAKTHVNGIELCFDCFGDKTNPPILLIMGLATQLIHWDEDFCKALASKGFFVIRFDNRDIGNSSKLHDLGTLSIPMLMAHGIFRRRAKAPYFLDDMARDAFGLLDHLGISNVHVVGVSMGGMIAQCMAISHPERVMSLTSIMSTTGAPGLPKPKASVSLKLAAPMPKDIEGYVRQGLKTWKLLHGDHFTFDTKRITRMLETAHKRCHYPPGIIRQLSAIILSGDRTEQLRSLTMPSLVLHGDIDPLVPLGCGEATAAAIPGAKLKIYEGMGHTLPSQLWQDMIDEIVKNCVQSDESSGSNEV